MKAQTQTFDCTKSVDNGERGQAFAAVLATMRAVQNGMLKFTVEAKVDPNTGARELVLKSNGEHISKGAVPRKPGTKADTEPGTKKDADKGGSATST